MNEQGMDEFFQNFYRSEPAGRVTEALESVISSDLPRGTPWQKDAMAHWFAAVARSRPQLTREYAELRDRHGTSKAAKEFVDAILEKVQRPPAIEEPVRDARDLDRLWHEFFVTGEKAPVRRIVEVLGWPDLVRERLESEMAARGRGGFRRRKLERALRRLERDWGISYDLTSGEVTNAEDLDSHCILVGFVRSRERFQSIQAVLPFSLSDADKTHVGTKASAAWSLWSLAQRHPLVLETLREEESKSEWRTRRLLAAIAQDVGALEQAQRASSEGAAHPSPQGSVTIRSTEGVQRGMALWLDAWFDSPVTSEGIAAWRNRRLQRRLWRELRRVGVTRDTQGHDFVLLGGETPIGTLWPLWRFGDHVGSRKSGRLLIGFGGQGRFEGREWWGSPRSAFRFLGGLEDGAGPDAFWATFGTEPPIGTGGRRSDNMVIEEPLASEEDVGHVPDDGGSPKRLEPTDIRFEYPERLSRWLLLVKWLLVIPAYLTLALYGVAVWLTTFISFWAILFTGRYPEPLFRLAEGYLRLGLRTVAYFPGLTTDRYPLAGLGERAGVGPIDLDVAYPERLWRPRLLLKLFSHVFGVFAVLSSVALLILIVVSVPAWFVVLIVGSYPRRPFDFTKALVRWVFRANTWQFLLRDEWSLLAETRGGAAVVGAGALVAALFSALVWASPFVAPEPVTSAFAEGDCSDFPATLFGGEPDFVDCNEPHDLEVFYVTEHPANSDEPFPGEGLVVEQGGMRCLGEFQPFVGRGYEQSQLAIFVATPDEEAWNELEDRTVICSLYRLDGQKMTGTARGSGL